MSDNYDDHGAELAELRRDKDRLDWLEKIGFSTIMRANVEKESGVHCWRDQHGAHEWGWTAHWISSEFKNARAAIDAAMGSK